MREREGVEHSVSNREVYQLEVYQLAESVSRAPLDDGASTRETASACP